MQEKKHPTVIIILACLIVVFCFSLTALILSVVSHETPTSQPGQIIFLDEPDDLLISLFNDTDINELRLSQDIEVSTYLTTEYQPSDDLLIGIQIPTVDFYNPLQNITIDSSNLSALPDGITLTPIQELTSTSKLLSLNGNYYLDTLDSGAIFRLLHFSGSPEDVVKITTEITPKLPDFPSRETILSLAQTGVTAPSRGMYTKLLSVGNASYFAENLIDFLKQFDYKHTSNESSFSTLANSNNICAAPAMLDLITSLDFNIIELTGNHNLDCGDTDALNTSITYHNLGIKTVGGGATAELAAEPLILNDKGAKITFLAYNYSTGGYTLDQTPGANFFTLEKTEADIATAEARGDFIIVDIQFFECNAYDNTSDDPTCDYANSSAGDQIGFFRKLINLGANIVVGTAAHQPQTYELYHDGAIYYGLGNLFFDQAWWPGTTRSLILVHYFWHGQHIQTRIVPTVYDRNFQTKLMDTSSAESFITRLNRARPKENS